ncbi:MAG: hypothetical protein GY849_02595 [Deltaproteobacteria bacterium]|nr:hypothetical protein [Deltaproteobacteria bacterium]
MIKTFKELSKDLQELRQNLISKISSYFHEGTIFEVEDQDVNYIEDCNGDKHEIESIEKCEDDIYINGVIVNSESNQSSILLSEVMDIHELFLIFSIVK